MAFKPKSMMDIDIDSSTCQLLPLKRYNSAPYINTTLGDIHTSSESMTQTIGTVARWTLVLFNITVHKMKYLTFDVFALFCVLSEYIYIGLNIKPECQ